MKNKLVIFGIIILVLLSASIIIINSTREITYKLTTEKNITSMINTCLDLVNEPTLEHCLHTLTKENFEKYKNYSLLISQPRRCYCKKFGKEDYEIYLHSSWSI